MRWQRTHFMPFGRPAMHLYVVYGELARPLDVPVNRFRHRSRGLPDGVTLGVNDHWDEGHQLFLTPPFLELLRDQHPELFDLVLAAPHSALLRGETPDEAELACLRDGLGVVSALLDSGGLAVLDPQTLRWWSKEEWLAAFVARAEFRWEDHVALLETGDWLHTRGLRKFGRVDLSLRGVTPDRRPIGWALVRSCAEFQVNGGLVDHTRPLLVEGLAPMTLVPHYATKDFDDPRFNNIWLEIEGFA